MWQWLTYTLKEYPVSPAMHYYRVLLCQICSLFILSQPIIKSIPDIRYSERVKFVYIFDADWNADFAGFRMDTEWALEEMVDSFADVDVKSRVTVLQSNLITAVPRLTNVCLREQQKW